MIDITPFRPQHAEGVVSVILPIQQAEFEIPITLEAQPDLPDIPGFYQQGKGNFWVAFDGLEVVGSVALLDIGNGQARCARCASRPAIAARGMGWPGGCSTSFSPGATARA